MSLAPGFLVPSVMDYKGYQSYIDEMLPSESPYLYGLHPNAEIEFLTTTANELFRTVFEMQPRDSGAEGGGAAAKEEKVQNKRKRGIHRSNPSLQSIALNSILFSCPN